MTDDPNKLIRQSAGTYRSADGRFEVTGDANRWFLIDTQQTDDLGQPVLQGPFATLNAVREALPAARRTDLKPVARPPAKGTKKPRVKTAAPPPTWIDKLPAAEAVEVRALIRALEREGIGDAEKLVQRDRQGLAPAVATRLVERRLEQILDELPADAREPLRALLSRVTAVLSDEGSRPNEPLPGWVLVEVGPTPEPPNRRIRLPD